MLDLKFFSAQRVLIFTHKDADPDALASVMLLNYGLRSMGVDCHVAPMELNRHSQGILNKIKIDRSGEGGCEGVDCADYDVYIGVDTATPAMAPNNLNIIERMDRCVILDHHTPTGEWDGVKAAFIVQRPSCVEVVLEILEYWGIRRIPKPYLKLAAVGIIYDTAGLRFATPSTLQTMARILEGLEWSITEVTELGQHRSDISERLAVVKGAQRMHVERHGDMLIAWSVVGAFEASVAKKLLSLGIDVAFVGSERKGGEIRISARASERVQNAGIDLTYILPAIKDDFDLSGGGHPGAMGLQGTGDIEAVLKAMATLIKERFTSPNQRVKSINGQEA